MGVITTRIQRKLQCGCSVGRKDQQQHECRGSCHTDTAVAVAEPWAAVQRMLGREAQHQHRDRCQMIRVILSEEYY